MSRGKHIRGLQFGGAAPSEPGMRREVVPRTEREETRRAARNWLRDRDERTVVDFEDGTNEDDWYCQDVRY